MILDVGGVSSHLPSSSAQDVEPPEGREASGEGREVRHHDSEGADRDVGVQGSSTHPDTYQGTSQAVRDNGGSQATTQVPYNNGGLTTTARYFPMGMGPWLLFIGPDGLLYIQYH